MTSVTKNTIKAYWETKLPQQWYSNNQNGTEKYWDEITAKRYSIYYPYLKEEAEFYDHLNQNVLEIGIGVGTDALEYAKGNANVTGIDLTQNAIDITSERFKQKGLKGSFMLGDAEDLQFKDDTFDLVFSFGVLHHTPNTRIALTEIRRVLKPDGKAIIMLYAKGWKHYLVKILYHGILHRELSKMTKQEFINKYSETDGDSPLSKVYSKSEVEDLFTGWNSVSIRRHKVGIYKWGAPYTTILTELINRIFKIERVIGENWLIKAIK